MRRAPQVEALEDRRLLATLTVNTVDDVVADGDGFLSLREAVLIANDSTGGTSFEGISSTDLADTVLFDGAAIAPDLSITLNGTSLPLVSEPLTVNGLVGVDAAIEIDADGSSGIFDSISDLTLNDLQLVNGNSATDGGALVSRGTLVLDSVNISDSVAAFDGGAIYSAGDASLTNVNVINNQATRGGGIWNGSGTLTIDATTIDGNTASGNSSNEGGGGIFNDGGSLALRNNSVVSDNSAVGSSGSGGGILNHTGGVVVVDSSTLSGNVASRAGGGIEDASGSGLGITLTSVTLTNNSTGPAPGNGGGLHVTGSGDVSITGGTITGNTASQEGGGLWNNTGTMTINGTTISGNTANSESNGGNDQGGGGIFNIGGTLQINDATISSNVANLNLGNGGGVMTVGGTVNIDGGTINGNTAARAGGGIENNNGTVTLTDVTVDVNTAGINGGGLHVSGPGTTNVDDGSFTGNLAGQEGGGLWNSTGTMTINGTTISGNTANSENNGGNDQGGGGIFNIGGTLQINDATISSNVANLNLGNGGGVMTVGGTVNIDGGTISGNTAARAGGGIENNDGTVTLTDVTVDVNTAGINGGGLHVSGPGTTNVNDGSFTGNLAGQEGGGLWNSTGTMTINGTTISGNTANSESNAGNDQGGGGIFNIGGTLQINDATISSNVANLNLGNGGGVMTVGGTVNIDGGTISGNTAARAGGGIENNDGTVTLTDVTIDGNSAGVNGGGLHVSGPGTTNVNDGSFTGNLAGQEGGGLWNGSGTMTINATEISGNTASGDNADQGGGGIFNAGGTVNVFNATVDNNLADGSSGSGGGILNDAGGTVSLFDSGLFDNVANRAGGGIEATAGTTTNLTGTNLIGNNAGVSPDATAAPGNGGGLHITGDGDVTILGGTVSDNVADREGGGLWNGSGAMTITGTTISGNTASGDAADDGGGGIFNNGNGGAVVLQGVILRGNVADGLSGSGGGLMNINGGSVSVLDSLIEGNTASRAGGGIEDNSGTLISIVDSTLRGNNAGTNPGNGGGIHITGAGTVSIDGSTISGNTAVEGGGIWNSGSGTFTLTNSTLSGNVATGSDGGGVFNTDGGTINTDSVTITLNTASTGIGSGIAGGSDGVTIENTIVAQNPGGGTEQNLSGSINSLDFNLIGDADEGALTGLTVNTIFAANARLLPLVNNGGSTATHLPASGSAAIGFGRTDLDVDQRDVARPQGGQDDIGAVEVDLNGFVIDADELTAGQAGDGNPDEFLIVNDPTGITGEVLVYVNSELVFAEPQATTGLIVIRGSADDDTLIIDNSEGLIGANIVFDGDGGPRNDDVGSPGGFDVLRLVGSTVAETTYNPGETADAGAVFQEDGEVIQRVEFFGLEPVQVLGAGGTLNVAAAPLGVGFPQALQASNSINYTEGPNSNDPVDPVFAGALTGLVTVDGFESLEFAGFETLNLDAGAGSDEINLNNPVTPGDLTTINVTAGDPTAGSDTVVVNGTSAQDTITVDQLTLGGAVVTGAQPVTVNVADAEQLIIHGQGGNDDLTVIASAVDEVAFTPNAFEDAGSLAISSDTFGPFQRRVPLHFQDLGADGSLTIDSDDGTRNLDFVVRGTDLEDRFTVDSADTVQIFRGSEGFLVTLPINTPGVGELFLHGLGGDDRFDVDGDHPFPQGIVVSGGTPDSGSDVLNFSGGGAAVNLDLDFRSITESGFNAVTYEGIETINLAANAALTVDGSAGNDTFDVTPGGAGNDGTFDHNGSAGIDFRYSAATSITFQGDGGSADELNLIGDEVSDVVTAAGAAITLDGSEVTLGTGIEAVSVVGLGGDDDIDLSGLVFATGVTIRGGEGNDQLIGSPQNDLVFGDLGNDILVGGGGDDVQFGGDGNDLFGNLTLTPDGTADDPGADQNFGGDGFDNFVWEPGDGADINNGGDDAADLFRFFGAAAGGETFTLRSGGTPTHFNALFGGLTIDNHGIEDVLVDPQGGADTVTIADLFATEVVNVSVNVAAGDTAITVAGRTTDDDLHVTASATDVAVEGLVYDIHLLNTSTTDTLTVETLQGDDAVHIAAGVEAILATTVSGGEGDDHLSGVFGTANGGAGDDVIVGGLNDQTINGDEGADTIVGGAGNDTIDGGEDFDTILIQGTSGADVIDVYQAAATTLNHTVNGVLEVDTLVLDGDDQTVEQARIVAGDGADLIRVNWLDDLAVNAGADSLRMSVEGGSDSTSDRLVVVDDGTDDLVLYRKGVSDDDGTVQIGPDNDEPLLNVFSGIETVNFVDESGTAIVNDPAGSQLVVFKHDPFESNDDRFTATYVGSGLAINVDPTIDPGPLANPFGDGQDLAGDHDFYRLVAESTGTLDLQVYFRQVTTLASGRPGLPDDGNLDINVLDAAGNIIAGFGNNDADDDERVRIPAVAGQTYYLQVLGSGNAINVYSISAINHAPPIPYALELLDNPADGTTNPDGTSTNSDTGRTQFDDVTYDDTPTLFFRLDDGIFLNDLPGNPTTGSPPDEIIPIPFQPGVDQPVTAGYAIAIFDEGDSTPQTGTAPQTPLGFATAVAGQQGVYTFTVPDGSALSEGSHFLTARVQMIDPADPQQTGFGGRSHPLEIIVDTTPPEVAFGLASVADDGLHADSDSGDSFLEDTLADRITNDRQPTFFGRAEANTIVRAYVDLDDSGTLTAGDLLIGQAVATPADGSEQLGTPLDANEPGGQWELTSTIGMNDPRITAELGFDGVRRILLSGEDLAGNITAADQVESLEIFIDTQGPQVTDVFLTDTPDFNLFSLKPESPQPTPAVNSLTIEVQDLPDRVSPFFYAAISNVPPLTPFVLSGDHSGTIAIESVTYIDTNSGPGLATGEIVLTFAEPLPDDRFTLLLLDSIIDPAGNALDGESNAVEPIGDPAFPSGDGIPGGNFVARFTVDSRPEVATWAQGVVYADINGNLIWDPHGEAGDATNRDFVLNVGEITDAPFTGNFSAVDTSSGFDKIGVYGAFNGVFQFFLDTDDDAIGDLVPNMAYQVNAIPVAGNFFNSAADDTAVANGQRPRDEIGAYDGTYWYLDTDGNNQIDLGERFATDLRGIPMVGDFNGDGFDDLATFHNETGQFQFDLDRDGDVDDTLTFGFPGFGERPVAGDFNLDGIDDIGLWVPGQLGQLPRDAGEFHVLLSDETPITLPQAAPVVGVGPSVIFEPYSPAPLGNDLVAQFGDAFALPLLGNFDPPVDGGGGGATILGSLSNQTNRFDTNVDGRVSALDALVVINALGRGDFTQLSQPLRVVASLGGFQLDASEDGSISSLDALQVINELARLSVAEAEPEWTASADLAIADLDADEDDEEWLRLLAADAADRNGLS